MAVRDGRCALARRWLDLDQNRDQRGAQTVVAGDGRGVADAAGLIVIVGDQPR